MKTLIAELEQTKQHLIDVVSSIKDEDTDRIPFEGSWRAGQLLEHLSKSVNSGILHGNTKPSGRQADEKVPMIRTVFLDLTTKYEAPDFIVPVETIHDKNELLNKLTGKFDRLIEAASTLDLDELCLDFVVPGFGEFTRLEWIEFHMIHTQRHLHQLKNIAEKLNG